jgi:hypothetical protein
MIPMTFLALSVNHYAPSPMKEVNSPVYGKSVLNSFRPIGRTATSAFC